MSDDLVFPPEFIAEIGTIERYGSSYSKNLATREGLSHLKALMEALVQSMPEDDRRKLIPRLRDDNDVNHRAALSEVLLYGYFRQSGHQVTLNAPLGNGTDADLLVTKSDCSFYVEVVTVIAPEANAINLRNQNRIINTLSNLKNVGYMAELEVGPGTAPDIPARAIKAILRRHINGVRSGEIRIQTPLDIGNVRLRLKPGNHPQGFVVATTYPLESQFLQHVHGRLDEKVRRFRNLERRDVPFLVALCGGEDLHQNFHRAIERAVLGWDPCDPTYMLPSGPSSLSGVLSCAKYIHTNEVQLDLELIHNPGAAAPINVDCLPDVRHMFPEPVEPHGWTGTVRGASEGLVVLSSPS